MKVEQRTTCTYHVTAELVRHALAKIIGGPPNARLLYVRYNTNSGLDGVINVAGDESLEIITEELSEREQVDLRSPETEATSLTTDEILSVLQVGAMSVAEIAGALARPTLLVYDMLNAHAGVYWHRLHAELGSGEKIDLWTRSEDLV